MRLQRVDVGLQSSDLLLEREDLVERGGAGQQLLQAITQRDVAAQPRLKVGILVGDVGTGEVAVPLLPKSGDAVHDAVELRRGHPGRDLHVAVATPARALEVPARFLNHMLHVPAHCGGRVDHHCLLPGAHRHPVQRGRGRGDGFGGRDVMGSDAARGGDAGENEGDAGAMQERA